MKTRKNILVAVNAAEHSFEALRWTLANLHKGKAKLWIVNVQPNAKKNDLFQKKPQFMVEMQRIIVEACPEAEEQKDFVLETSSPTSQKSEVWQLVEDFAQSKSCSVIVVGEKNPLDEEGTRWSYTPLHLIKNTLNAVVVVRKTCFYSNAAPLIEMFGAKDKIYLELEAKEDVCAENLAFDVPSAGRIGFKSTESVSSLKSTLSPESSSSVSEEEFVLAAKPKKKKALEASKKEGMDDVEPLEAIKKLGKDALEPAKKNEIEPLEAIKKDQKKTLEPSKKALEPTTKALEETEKNEEARRDKLPISLEKDQISDVLPEKKDDIEQQQPEIPLKAQRKFNRELPISKEPLHHLPQEKEETSLQPISDENRNLVVESDKASGLPKKALVSSLSESHEPKSSKSKSKSGEPKSPETESEGLIIGQKQKFTPLEHVAEEIEEKQAQPVNVEKAFKPEEPLKEKDSIADGTEKKPQESLPSDKKFAEKEDLDQDENKAFEKTVPEAPQLIGERKNAKKATEKMIQKPQQSFAKDISAEEPTDQLKHEIPTPEKKLAQQSSSAVEEKEPIKESDENALPAQIDHISLPGQIDKNQLPAHLSSKSIDQPSQNVLPKTKSAVSLPETQRKDNLTSSTLESSQLKKPIGTLGRLFPRYFTEPVEERSEDSSQSKFQHLNSSKPGISRSQPKANDSDSSAGEELESRPQQEQKITEKPIHLKDEPQFEEPSSIGKLSKEPEPTAIDSSEGTPRKPSLLKKPSSVNLKEREFNAEKLNDLTFIIQDQIKPETSLGSAVQQEKMPLEGIMKAIDSADENIGASLAQQSDLIDESANVLQGEKDSAAISKETATKQAPLASVVIGKETSSKEHLSSVKPLEEAKVLSIESKTIVGKGSEEKVPLIEEQKESVAVQQKPHSSKAKDLAQLQPSQSSEQVHSAPQDNAISSAAVAPEEPSEKIPRSITPLPEVKSKKFKPEKELVEKVIKTADEKVPKYSFWHDLVAVAKMDKPLSTLINPELETIKGEEKVVLVEVEKAGEEIADARAKEDEAEADETAEKGDFESAPGAETELESSESVEAKLKPINSAEAESQHPRSAEPEFKAIQTPKTELESSEIAESEFAHIESAETESEPTQSAETQLKPTQNAETQLKPTQKLAKETSSSSSLPQPEKLKQETTDSPNEQSHLNPIEGSEGQMLPEPQVKAAELKTKDVSNANKEEKPAKKDSKSLSTGKEKKLTFEEELKQKLESRNSSSESQEQISRSPDTAKNRNLKETEGKLPIERSISAKQGEKQPIEKSTATPSDHDRVKTGIALDSAERKDIGEEKVVLSKNPIATENGQYEDGKSAVKDLLEKSKPNRSDSMLKEAKQSDERDKNKFEGANAKENALIAEKKSSSQGKLIEKDLKGASGNSSDAINVEGKKEVSLQKKPISQLIQDEKRGAAIDKSQTVENIEGAGKKESNVEQASEEKLASVKESVQKEQPSEPEKDVRKEQPSEIKLVQQEPPVQAKDSVQQERSAKVKGPMPKERQISSKESLQTKDHSETGKVAPKEKHDADGELELKKPIADEELKTKEAQKAPEKPSQEKQQAPEKPSMEKKQYASQKPAQEKQKTAEKLPTLEKPIATKDAYLNVKQPIPIEPTTLIQDKTQIAPTEMHQNSTNKPNSKLKKPSLVWEELTEEAIVAPQKPIQEEYAIHKSAEDISSVLQDEHFFPLIEEIEPEAKLETSQNQQQPIPTIRGKGKAETSEKPEVESHHGNMWAQMAKKHLEDVAAAKKQAESEKTKNEEHPIAPANESPSSSISPNSSPQQEHSLPTKRQLSQEELIKQNVIHELKTKFNKVPDSEPTKQKPEVTFKFGSEATQQDDEVSTAEPSKASNESPITKVSSESAITKDRNESASSQKPELSQTASSQKPQLPSAVSSTLPDIQQQPTISAIIKEYTEPKPEEEVVQELENYLQQASQHSLQDSIHEEEKQGFFSKVKGFFSVTEAVEEEEPEHQKKTFFKKLLRKKTAFSQFPSGIFEEQHESEEFVEVTEQQEEPEHTE